jgi:hypothetical protein
MPTEHVLGYFFQNQMSFPFLAFPYYFGEKSTTMLVIKIYYPGQQDKVILDQQNK